jgi:hypothetical protein
MAVRHEKNLAKGEALRMTFKVTRDLKADVLVTDANDGCQ